MKEHIKIILIVLAFVLITVLLFRPYSCVSKQSGMLGEEYEHYNASFDSKYVDPRVHPYSTNVTYRPDSNVRFGLDDIANTDSTKIFDHLADQKRGLNEYDNTYDTDPRHNAIRPFNGRQPNVNEMIRENVRRIRDASNRPSQFELDTKTVQPPYASSYTDTDINADSMFESNNIVRYCSNTIVDHGDTAPRFTNNVPTDRPYARIIGDADIGANMDMNDKEYHDMTTSRPNMETYIRINNDYGHFSNKDNDVKKDINGLTEISNVIDAYRNNTLDSIQGTSRDGYSKNEYSNASAQTGIKMY
jgi:hypothetical protein